MIRNFTLIAWVSLVLFTSIKINAATITSTALGGEWNASATWQDNVIPTIADDVIIQSGSSVTISIVGGTYAPQCKSLLLNGSLSHSSNSFQVGTGYGGKAPFIVNGTLNLSAGYANSVIVNGYLKFNSGSTFNMILGSLTINGNDGTLSGSVPSGTAILDVSAISTLNLTAGAIYILNPHFINGEPCIKGAKTFGATVSLGNGNNPLSSTDYVIASSPDQPVFNNFEIFYNPASGTKARLKGLTIQGAFGLNGHLLNAGGTEKIFVGGDMNIGNYGVVEGDIEFNGTAQQNINSLGTITSILFKGNLIANSSRVKTKLDVEIQSPYALRLEKGLFDVGNHILTLNTPVVVTNPSKTKYISLFDLYGEKGALKINNIATETLFPVGYEMGIDFSSYTPLKITPSDPSNFMVKVKPMVLSTIGYEKMNVEWDISRNNSASANIVFQWNKADELGKFGNGTNRDNAKISHHNGGGWDLIASTSTIINDTTFSRTGNNITSFSPFTILTIAPLPVSLTEFKAKAVGNRAILTWSTASESNNQGFEVEKSLDGIQFDNIGFVKGNGNSNILLSYIFSDENFTQTAFYRLKQVDFDGKTEYSRIVQLEKSKSGVVKIYPNLIAQNEPLSIEVNADSKEALHIALVDISGRIIFQNKYIDATNVITIPTNDFVRGLYFVKVQSGLKSEVFKIVKN
jgi:Secretion system C-terminal sorting domain